MRASRISFVTPSRLYARHDVHFLQILHDRVDPFSDPPATFPRPPCEQDINATVNAPGLKTCSPPPLGSKS